jgi:hypothetical protein
MATQAQGVRMFRRSIVAFAFLSLFVAGCGAPTPEKVCGKVKTLAEKGDDKWSDKKNDRCMDALKELQKDNKEGYECIAKCVMAADDFKSATRECDKTCKDKMDKKKDKADDDSDKKKKSDDDDTSKKKKKSADDDDDTAKKKKTDE